MTLLGSLAAHFFLLSLVSFGGVSAIVPEMHRVLVGSMGLMGDREFTALFALSQAAPGPNLMFVALVGSQAAGVTGGLVSLAAMCGPTTFLALAVERWGGRGAFSRWYVVARRALAPITIGLLTATGWVLLRGGAGPASAPLAALTAVLVIRTRLNPLWLIAAGAALGAAGYL